MFFSKNGSLSFFFANFVFVSINFLFLSQKNTLIQIANEILFINHIFQPHGSSFRAC